MSVGTKLAIYLTTLTVAAVADALFTAGTGIRLTFAFAIPVGFVAARLWPSILPCQHKGPQS